MVSLYLYNSTYSNWGLPNTLLYVWISYVGKVTFNHICHISIHFQKRIKQKCFSQTISGEFWILGNCWTRLGTWRWMPWWGRQSFLMHIPERRWQQWRSWPVTSMYQSPSTLFPFHIYLFINLSVINKTYTLL